MNIFNSLGSNYSLNYAFSILLSPNPDNVEKEFGLLEKTITSNRTFFISKGREALELGLKSLKLPSGSQVAITGFTCSVVEQAVINSGLKPVFLDIDPETLNFTPDTLKKAFKTNPNLKAVIIQNTLGFPCQINEIKKLCQKNNCYLIEDLAHSIGSKYDNDINAGSIGDLAALSFSQDKILDSVTGGVLIINNQNIKVDANYKLMEIPFWTSIKLHAYPLLTYAIRAGYPFLFGKLLHYLSKKMHLLADPLGRKQPKNAFYSFPGWLIKPAILTSRELYSNIAHRQQIAEIYADSINQEMLSAQICKLIPNSTCIRFPIFTKNRNSLVNYLKKSGIYLSDIWYDAPVAPQKFLGNSVYNGECPISELISNTILNLPTHRNISIKKANDISNLINLWHKSHTRK